MAIVSFTNSVRLWIFERILSGLAQESLIRLKSVTPYWPTGSGRAVYCVLPRTCEKLELWLNKGAWREVGKLAFHSGSFCGNINTGVDIFHSIGTISVSTVIYPFNFHTPTFFSAIKAGVQETSQIKLDFEFRVYCHCLSLSKWDMSDSNQPCIS